MEKMPRLKRLGLVLLVCYMLRVMAESVWLAQGSTAEELMCLAILTCLFCVYSLALMTPHFLGKGSTGLTLLPWWLSGVSIEILWVVSRAFGSVGRGSRVALAALIGLSLLQYAGISQCHSSRLLARIFAVYTYETPGTAGSAMPGSAGPMPIFSPTEPTRYVAQVYQGGASSKEAPAEMVLDMGPAPPSYEQIASAAGLHRPAPPEKR